VLRPVSEWAAPELSIALNLTARAAEELLERSLTLVRRLPATLAALEAGALHAGHLWPLLEHVAPVVDDVLRAEVEADLLAWVGRRKTVTTPAQPGDKARCEVTRRNARDAARRPARALRERGVSVRPGRTDGMGEVTVICSLPEAQALQRALVAYADAVPTDPDPGTARTRGQKMVDRLFDLVLRPGENGLPPIQVLLTVVASMGTLLGGDAPGEVDGQVVPAEVVRQPLRALAARSAQAAQPTDLAAAAGAQDEPGSTTPVDTSARRPAAADSPARQPGSVHDTDAPGADSVERPWQEREQEELERWWAGVERRALAELEAQPERGPRDRPSIRRILPSGSRSPANPPTRTRHRTRRHRIPTCPSR
jgi:hypothetical protein